MRNAIATAHISGWTSVILPLTTLMNDLHDEARADADGDAEGQRHQDQPEQGREALLEVGEVDVLDRGRPSGSRRTPGPGRSPRTGTRPASGVRKIAARKSIAGHDRGEARPPTFGDAGRALDVAGVRADAGHATDGRARPSRPAGCDRRLGLPSSSARPACSLTAVAVPIVSKKSVSMKLKIVRTAARRAEDREDVGQVELAEGREVGRRDEGRSGAAGRRPRWR